jgi:O-antigen/teichoic acid export membrane protein
MSTARRVLGGAAWIYGAQVLTVFAQFVYAAITSRLVDDAGFGAYAVALSASGLASLLATTGLGQAVGRMQELDPRRTQGLLTYAVITGSVAAAAVAFGAPAWAQLWQAPESVPATQFAAVIVFLSPAFGVATALLRRMGAFRRFSVVTLLSNIAGMLLGAICVLWWPTASALLVSATVAQLLVLSYTLVAARSYLGRLGSPRTARSDITYSWRLMLTSIVSFANANIVKMVASRSIGLPAVGQWNRAEVVTTVPFQQFQTALAQALYPEFRHFRERPEAARQPWTDMLVLTAWLALPASTLTAVVAPWVIGVLFGDGWRDAQWIAPILALAAGAQVLGTLLAQGIESLGRFSWIWAQLLGTLAVFVGAAVAVFATADLAWGVYGTLAAMMARHAVQIILATAGGYLQGARLLQGYAGALGVAIAIALAALAPGLNLASGWGWVASATVAIVGGIVLACCWRRLPPVVIARRYGLLGRGT